jgi:hypothetical protein
VRVQAGALFQEACASVLATKIVANRNPSGPLCEREERWVLVEDGDVSERPPGRIELAGPLLHPRCGVTQMGSRAFTRGRSGVTLGG